MKNNKIKEGEIAYLEDGSQVKVHNIISDDKYVIERYYEFDSEDKYDIPTLSGKQEVVDKVFSLPPEQAYYPVVARYNKRIAEAIKKEKELDKGIDQKRDLLRKLEGEIEKAKEAKSNVSDMIFNGTEILNADKIAFFYNYNLFFLDNELLNNEMMISFIMKKVKDTRIALIPKSDGFFKDKIYIQSELLINPTEEEILNEGRRIVNRDIANGSLTYGLEDVNDKYLTKELIEKKYGLIKSRINRNINDIKEGIARYEKRLQEEEEKLKEIN